MMMFRMKTLVSFVCVGALSLCVSATGRADTPAQNRARREIAATYAKMARAMMRKDLPTLSAIEAADYQAFTKAGLSRSREQDLETTRRLFLLVKQFPKMQSKILSLTWRGPDAVVMAQTTPVSIMNQAGKTGRMEGVVITRDYWSRSAGGWQIRQSVEREGKVWLNGQRVQ
jgi:ketosteroid isomerase-like protein